MYSAHYYINGPTRHEYHCNLARDYLFIYLRLRVGYDEFINEVISLSLPTQPTAMDVTSTVDNRTT